MCVAQQTDKHTLLMRDFMVIDFTDIGALWGASIEGWYNEEGIILEDGGIKI